MFYNLENLYDTVKDSNTDDGEFTPEGEKRWTKERYNIKLANLSEVVEAVAKSGGSFGGFIGKEYPAIIGVSEVEHIGVMQDLAAQPRMAPAHYKCVHYESNDARGVDVGAFYRPDVFELMGSEPVKLVLRSGREYIGRDILAMWGLLDGELYAFYICHWLSRRAGVDASAGFRRAGADTVRDHAEEMKKKFPGIRIVIMGDMNDNPTDDSLAILLKARRDPSEVGKGEYYNPFWRLYDQGYGSSKHFNRWVMYDNILVSRNLCHSVERAEVFSRRFMMHKGNPKRCYCGNNFCSGYSDHLPVVVNIKTNNKENNSKKWFPSKVTTIMGLQKKF